MKEAEDYEEEMKLISDKKFKLDSNIVNPDASLFPKEAHQSKRAKNFLRFVKQGDLALVHKAL